MKEIEKSNKDLFFSLSMDRSGLDNPIIFLSVLFLGALVLYLAIVNIPIYFVNVGLNNILLRDFALLILFILIINVIIFKIIDIGKQNHQHYSESNDIKDLIEVDLITTLYNHKSIVKKLDCEVQRARRYQRNLSVVLMELDDYEKKILSVNRNLNEGIILTLSKIIKESCRTTDFIGHYSDNKFLLIFPETSLKSSILVGKRIKESFNTDLLLNNSMATLSCGVVELTDEDVHEMLANAENTLRSARDLGENQIYSFKKLNTPVMFR